MEASTAASQSNPSIPSSPHSLQSPEGDGSPISPPQSLNIPKLANSPLILDGDAGVGEVETLNLDGESKKDK